MTTSLEDYTFLMQCREKNEAMYEMCRANVVRYFKVFDEARDRNDYKAVAKREAAIKLFNSTASSWYATFGADHGFSVALNYWHSVEHNG